MSTPRKHLPSARSTVRGVVAALLLTATVTLVTVSEMVVNDGSQASAGTAKAAESGRPAAAAGSSVHTAGGAVGPLHATTIAPNIGALVDAALGGTALVTPAPANTPPADTSPVVASLAANGIPTVALDAYRTAAAAQAKSTPTCHVVWPDVAGIGAVESNHGRHGGAALHADGLSAPPIIGIALDGTTSDLIPDTDGGRLDGDVRYDRAVGPMQFIPSTWAAIGLDGNHDGQADPFNIYDAARTTAAYLCAHGRDLATAPGLTAAILSYNNNQHYLALVSAAARRYASGDPALLVPNIEIAPVPASPPTTTAAAAAAAAVAVAGAVAPSTSATSVAPQQLSGS